MKIDNTDAEQIERLNSRVAELLRERDAALAEVAAFRSVAQRAPSPTAEDIYACCKTTLIGFQELNDASIEFICDQISRKATITSTGRNPIENKEDSAS